MRVWRAQTPLSLSRCLSDTSPRHADHDFASANKFSATRVQKSMAEFETLRHHRTKRASTWQPQLICGSKAGSRSRVSEAESHSIPAEAPMPVTTVCCRFISVLSLETGMQKQSPTSSTSRSATAHVENAPCLEVENSANCQTSARAHALLSNCCGGPSPRCPMFL